MTALSRRARPLPLPSLIVVLPFVWSAVHAAPGTANRLDELGLKASGTAVVLAAERELTSELDRAKDLRRNLAKAATAVATHEKAFQKGSEQLDGLRGQLVQLNAQFSSLPGGDADRHNQLVASINAVSGQVDLLTAQRSRAEEEGRKLRGTLTEAREAYLQFVLDARKRADAVQSEYATRAADPKVREAVSELSTAESKEYRFGPSPAFQAALRRLTSLEEAVLSETIDLERDGKVLRASVSINGGKPHAMMVDSGSSTVLVPSRFAEEFDVVPEEYDQKVTCTLADGRQVEGTLKKLGSVRVGKFIVKDVECVVLGPEAVAAELLLGMSYLGRFEFKLNPDAGTLTMSRVEGAD
jgi:clan AA aspartic protease (TIGR02281 family)